jgi:hypothetical protein
MRGGVYVYRGRKPGARFNIPIISRHFIYVGETTSFGHRHVEHVQGGGKYGAVAKPWADLDPRVVMRIPLPPWKWLLRSVETVLIGLTWPVYNHRKNQWNPRRIPLSVAHRQRLARDRGRHPFNVRPVHLFVFFVLLIAAAVVTHR